ncbi:MAG: TonB-dependent receptor [Rhodospirillales bacterium]|nr:TonB-dependent receptor [Rhodospirillales bacterium]MCY4096943.1 TonB-dependent receptor [Rhodospirillales bacterium]
MKILLRSARRLCVPALGAVVLIAAGSSAVPVVAQETLPEVEVIGVTPMPGTGVARDRVPAAVQTITDEEIDALQPRNLTDLVEQTLRGVSVTDVQNSPYQQNLSYRGFTLSPLLGEAQGIAVYLNGVRINEGFGDTMQWDLVPEAAIRRIDLVGGNPAYGLNALGGALSLQTQSGLSFSGSELEIKGGSHGRLDTAVQVGGRLDATAVYLAAERGEEDGWRDHSDSSILRLFGDATHVFDRGSLGFSALFARTEITGNGATPEDLLGIRRESVFTYPDITDNELGMFTARGEFEVSDNLRISGLVYHRGLQRDTINGDEFDGGFGDDGFLRAGEGEDDDDDDDDNGNGHAMHGDDDDDDDDNGNGHAMHGNGDDDDEEEEEQTILFGSVEGAGGTPEAIYLFGDDDDDFPTPGARNLTFTDTQTQGISLQADLTYGAHQVAFGMAYDQSETTFSGHTLVGEMEADRNVPAMLFADGQPRIVTHECEADDFEADEAECEEELEESDAGPLDVVSDSQTWGLYVSDTMALSGRTDVTFSGRFNHVAIDLQIDDDGTESHTFRRFNPAVGLTHRLTDRMTAFAGYREANRAPTAAELGCADPEEPCRLPNAFIADPPLDQVVTRSVEGGLRGRTSTAVGPLAWEVSAYASTNRDDIIFVAVPETGAQPGLGYFQNYGETRRAGFDGQVGGRFDRWDWNANYSHVRATFAEDAELPGANHPEGREIEGADEAKLIDVRSGDTIPGIPEHSVKVGLGYTLDNGLRIGANWVARSGVYLRGDESNQLAQTNDYNVVNLTVDWTFGALTLFGRIENLLGEDYETFGILGECELEEEGEPCEGEVAILNHGLPDDVHHTNRFLSPGAPQSFYIGMRYHF